MVQAEQELSDWGSLPTFFETFQLVKSIFLNSREITIIDRVEEAAYFHFASHLSGNQPLTFCMLVDSSTVICWTSPFVILGVLSVFCCFYSIFDDKSVSK